MGIVFRPVKSVIHLAVRMERTGENTAKLEASGLEIGDCDQNHQRYCLRLARSDSETRRGLLSEFFGKTLGS